MFRLLYISLLLSIFGFTDAYSQATANFTASVTIIEPIQITTTSNMNFASIDAKQGGGVILKPDNTRIATGGVKLDAATGASAATFEVKGQPGYTYDISLPADRQILTNGNKNIILKDFTSDFQNGRLAEGTQTIHLGASLEIDSGQTPGVYRSSHPMEVTVNYN